MLARAPAWGRGVDGEGERASQADSGLSVEPGTGLGGTARVITISAEIKSQTLTQLSLPGTPFSVTFRERILFSDIFLRSIPLLGSGFGSVRFEAHQGNNREIKDREEGHRILSSWDSGTPARWAPPQPGERPEEDGLMDEAG